ncbi:MAG TPA: thermonuclease family protein [Dongiaceae bacterium]|nr:thermonuclease family protein [Dongiaceae bacterium]
MSACAAALLASLVLAPAAGAKQQKPLGDEPAPPKAVPVQAVDAAPLLPVGATTTEGTPVVVNGDTLQIGDKTVRLYGIAAPDIRAEHGADARLALDQLIAQRRIQCTELDRTKDSVVIASCKADDADLGEQMLLTGYAAVYRSQINPTQQELDLAKRYDIAEAKARVQHIGLWALPTKPDAAAEAPKPLPEPWITRPMIQSWIVAAPILLIALLAMALYARARGRQGREERRQLRLNSTSLLAQILAEVLTIREAAAEQIGHIASLPAENPVPAAQLALMGLPPALIYAANAGQLYRLPRDTGVDLVQFYAAHTGIGMMLRQAAHLRADNLRHAYIKIVEAADLVLDRGQKQLD